MTTNSFSDDVKQEALSNFKQIEEMTKIFNLLSKISNDLPQGFFWKKGQEIKFYVRFIDFNQVEKKLYFRLIKSKNYENVTNNPFEQKDYFFNIAHQEGSLFFVSQFETSDQLNLKFLLPKKIYLVQRRIHPRLTFSFESKIILEYSKKNEPDTLYRGKIIDISSHGLAFHFHGKNNPFLIKGDILEPLIFKLKLKIFQLVGSVQHITESTQGDQTISKIGVYFTEISEEHRNILSIYVLEHLHLQLEPS